MYGIFPYFLKTQHYKLPYLYACSTNHKFVDKMNRVSYSISIKAVNKILFSV